MYLILNKKKSIIFVINACNSIRTLTPQPIVVVAVLEHPAEPNCQSQGQLSRIASSRNIHDAYIDRRKRGFTVNYGVTHPIRLPSLRFPTLFF